MKLSIETLEDRTVKVTLNFKGKDYSEIWIERDSEFGTILGTINESINSQIEKDNLSCSRAEITEIEGLLCRDIHNFIVISELESS